MREQTESVQWQEEVMEEEAARSTPMEWQKERGPESVFQMQGDYTTQRPLLQGIGEEAQSDCQFNSKIFVCTRGAIKGI